MRNTKKSIKSHEALQSAESGPTGALEYYATVTKEKVDKHFHGHLHQSRCKVHK